ncbi:MAG: transglycosylase SLT domain-containing protein, partial [Bdellovibrionia bacterium]
AGITILIKPEVLGHYAQSCKKKETPFCVSWLRKLTTIFSRQHAATQAILEAFPLPPEKHHSYRSQGRFSSTYKSQDLDSIAFESAMKLYLEDKFKEASKAFEQLLSDYPRTAFRGRARYWMAQAVAHSEGNEKAHKLFLDLQQEFPLTYYGLLASRETGIPVDSSINANLPLAEDKEPSLLPQELFHLKRAENFIAEKANELAAFELREFRPRDSLSNNFLVYLAMLTHKARCYSLLFTVLGELIQRGSEGVLSAYGLHLIFPTDYFDIISKSTDASQLEPLLVMSLIKQESSFDKTANSPAGAMGLMQIMPFTALDTDPKVVLSELLDANENIRVGVKYFNKLLNRYKGNIVYALGAYNAGPTTMDRWIKAAPSKHGMAEFIESITYRETREYVASIIRNHFWYSRQFKGVGTFDINYFWKTPTTEPVKGT